MKGVITIFTLPQELEDLALTLNMLKRNSIYLDGSTTYKVEVTMCVSDQLTDWSNSKLPKDYIVERTRELCSKFLGWCEYELLIEDKDRILGCVSQRRNSLHNNLNADFFIWLDCDFIFKDTTLSYMTQAYQTIKESNVDLFILTPQFVKQWDSTWDIIVNKNFMNKPYDYELVSDVYIDTLPDLEPVSIQQINGIKFAGGWFTLLSADLVREVGIPESIGHYGLEDTFIIECSKIINSSGGNVSQFILENLIIAESYTQRPNETIKQYISSKNKKQEFTKIATDNFKKEINRFYEKNR
jgi:hypothetical protein